MHQYDAAREGNLGRVRELVTAANLDERNERGETVLHYACLGGHHDVVAWLAGLRADVNARDSDGWTPLHYAANTSRPRCIKLLLDIGADASVANKIGYIPLHWAYKSAECTALLIAAHPAGVNAVNTYGSTPLHHAAECGAVDVCSLLLDAGSIIDAVNKDGYTPLYLAFLNDKRNAAELLLDRGARLELVKLSDYYLKAIPEWAVSFVARRNACRSSCWAVLELARRRSRVIGGNRRDALRLVAKCVWALRFSEL